MAAAPRTQANRFSRDLNLALTVDEVREVFFTHIDQVLPADGVGFYRFRGSRNPVTPDTDTAVCTRSKVDRAANLSRRFLDSYEEHGRRDDPVLDYAVEHRQPVDSSRLPTRRWEGSRARQLLASEGMEHSLEAALMVGKSVVGTINFARGQGSRAFSEEDLTTVCSLSEELNVAIERAVRHEQLGARMGALRGALDHFSGGVLVSDLQGTPLYTNQHAERILRGMRPAEDGTGRSRLHRMVNGAIDEFSQDERQLVTLSLRDSESGERVVLKVSKDQQHQAIVALLYDCPEAKTASLPEWEVLSPREQEIATMVSRGLTTKQIAAEAFISENTAKQHLKRIFTKTGVHSRAELVQLIWSAQRIQPVP